jgi:hypothetical protein
VIFLLRFSCLPKVISGPSSPPHPSPR